MNKDDLLKHVAEVAYNVGFGAKKHFATNDIITKAPGSISFVSLAFGIYALVFDGLAINYFSATFIVFGVLGLYISFYNAKKSEYAENGQKLTDLFNELKRLYGTINASNEPSDAHLKTLTEIEKAYTKVSSTNQILFSNWYAHYKFFWEQQIGWIDEQIKFTLFRDKIPLSLSLFVAFTLLGVATFSFDLLSFACTVIKP